MKWTRLALVLVIPALALLLLGQSMRSPAAEAKPTALLTITKTFCVVFGSQYDWDDDGDIDPDDGTAMFADCDNLQDNTVMGQVAVKLGGESTTDPKPEDFAPMDREGGQMHQEDGIMYLAVFVSNDDSVGFYTDEGEFKTTGTGTLFCGPASDPNSDYQDEDCDEDGDKGDGIVVAKLVSGSNMDRGPMLVRVRQGMLEMEEEIVVVGEPWNIDLAVTKPVIQAGAPSCILFTDTPAYIAAVGAPEQNPLVATVTDSDGTEVTGALVAWSVDDEYKATMAKPLTPTLESGLGLTAPMVLCGTVDTGTVTVTAKITDGEVEIPLQLDREARVGKKVKAEVTVQGTPTEMVLSASPASLVCDGTATTDVSANLTDAEGNPVVDGNAVRFEAKALSNVSPLEPTSAGGAATTTLIPLTSVAGGVTVRATMTQQSIDWQDLLDDYRQLIDPEYLSKLLDRGKPVDWRSVGDQCFNNTDDDIIDGQEDDVVNDGCPAIGDPETGSECDNRRDDDDDGYVNDGCPATDEGGPRPEQGGTACDDDVDNDFDRKVNDGCPAVGDPETGSECDDDDDDDSDGYINDGCPEAAVAETYVPRTDEVSMERNLLVACSEAAPAAAVPAAAPVPAISPPSTGDGGFLGP